MKHVYVKIGRGSQVRVPMRPNFLRLKDPSGREELLPLDYFTDEELWEVGQEFARELIRRSKAQTAAAGGKAKRNAQG